MNINITKIYFHSSSSGTFINKVKIGKNKEAFLNFGDELSLTEYHEQAPSISYIFAK